MPNVADELAALRAKGAVGNRAKELAAKGGSALSTPEAEAAALKAERENEKLGQMKAKETLAKGSNAAAQASAEKAAEFTAAKKADWEKKAQASEILSRGGSAGGYSKEMAHTLSQTGKKKADWEKKNETKSAMAGGSPPKAGKKADAKATQVAAKEAPTAAAAAAPVEVEEDDDVPDLEEAGDAVPDLENATQQLNAPDGGAVTEEERQITNRNEKKARKMMTRLGMRPVSNIARVTLKAGGGRGYFFIDRPDVFSSVGGKVDTYVIFGEAKQGGGLGGGGGNAAAAAAQAQAAMAQAQAQQAAMGQAMPSVKEEEGIPDLAAGEAEGAAAAGDEDGVEAKDIDLVMSQASCSRAKAVAALKENDGDLVNAIMSLTT